MNHKNLYQWQWPPSSGYCQIWGEGHQNWGSRIKHKLGQIQGQAQGHDESLHEAPCLSVWGAVPAVGGFKLEMRIVKWKWTWLSKHVRWNQDNKAFSTKFDQSLSLMKAILTTRQKKIPTSCNALASCKFCILTLKPYELQIDGPSIWEFSLFGTFTLVSWFWMG